MDITSVRQPSPWDLGEISRAIINAALATLLGRGVTPPEFDNRCFPMNAGSNTPRIARPVEVAPSESLIQTADGKPGPALDPVGALTLDHKAHRSGTVASSNLLATLSPSGPVDDTQASPHALAPARSTQWNRLPDAVASKVLLYCLTPGEAMGLAPISPEFRRAVAADALCTMTRQISTSSTAARSGPQTDEEALHRLRNPDTATLRAALGIVD